MFIVVMIFYMSHNTTNFYESMRSLFMNKSYGNDAYHGDEDSITSFLDSIHDFQYFNVELYEEVVDKIQYFIELYTSTKYIETNNEALKDMEHQKDMERQNIQKYIDMLVELKKEIAEDILNFSISAPNNIYMKKAQTAAEVIDLILQDYLDDLSIVNSYM